jgi:hypothetical protein
MAGVEAPANTVRTNPDCPNFKALVLVGHAQKRAVNSAGTHKPEEQNPYGAVILPTGYGVRKTLPLPEQRPAWEVSDALGEPRHRKRHWLSGAPWQLLVRAELIQGHRLNRATFRMWPGRPPYACPRRRCLIWSRREIVDLCLDALKGDPLYPAKEIEALAAAALAEVQP